MHIQIKYIQKILLKNQHYKFKEKYRCVRVDDGLDIHSPYGLLVITDELIKSVSVPLNDIKILEVIKLK